MIHTYVPMPISKETIARTLASPIGEGAYEIVEKLTDAGYDTWWVGGGVRDMLNEMLPKDIDIGTAATPQQVVAIFPKADVFPSVFGSVRVRAKGHEFEVTTFREDDEASDGRHPSSVIFGTREADAKRRDITINAIYFHPIYGNLYDPCNGEADLDENLIRIIGEPGIRIRHDVLRMLRVVRFRALLDGQYHPETYRALQEQAPLIEKLSGSRQLEEMQKMLMGPHPDRAFEDLWELQILQRFLPEVAICKGIPQPADYHHEGDVWDHTMQILRSFREDDNPDVRLAALFHDCGKAETFSLKERIRFDHHATISAEKAATALMRMQMQKTRCDKIAWLVKHHMMMGAFQNMPQERKAHWYFHPWFQELLRVFWLDIAGTTPQNFDLYDSILKDYYAFLDSRPRPPKQLLTGEDIMEILGVGPGEEVGKALQELHDAQIKGEVKTKSEASEFINNMSGFSK